MARSPAPTSSEIQEWLTLRLSELTGIPAHEVDPARPFESYGLGSVEAVGLSGDLSQRVGRELSATLVWDHPTIEALADWLASGEESHEPAAGPDEEAEAIAVVGLSCRFPQAPDERAYWDLLREGRDAVTEVPPDRWDAGAFHDPDPRTPGRMTTRWGGFLEGIDRFDAAFFGIPPREALRMDPQQRLLLELAWEALEGAGIVPKTLAGEPVGVFLGITSSDHGHLLVRDAALEDAYLGTGNALSIAANRVSYAFDLRGPSLAVDTACSSSLVAVQLACESLRRGESTLALAGGVNLILDPSITVNFSKAGFMAPDGRCRAFDARAGGYVRSEGGGFVVLQRLDEARAQGRHIRAVIRGGAVNQDGRSNGLTAPSRQSQERVLREAYRRAGISPGKVQYVETHGTGTPLGDPIEARALGAVLATERPPDTPCTIGSVKTNVGHLEGAAGIAGLIKVVLALEHRELPAHLHFQRPNPHIPFHDLPLRVPVTHEPWPGSSPRIAGVSSFGFGGTNAHLVVEEGFPRLESTPSWLPRGELLPLFLSAHTEGALRDLARTLARELAGPNPPDLADLARTLGRHRTHHPYRWCRLVRNIQHAVRRLGALAEGRLKRPSRTPHTRGPRPGFAFIDPGPGVPCEFPPWMRDIPLMRSVLEACDRVSPDKGWSLLDDPGSEAGRGAHAGATRLLAMHLALEGLVRSWGLEPASVFGHGRGELSAAVVAGVLTLPEAMGVARRMDGGPDVPVPRSRPPRLPFRSHRLGRRVEGAEWGPDGLVAQDAGPVGPWESIGEGVDLLVEFSHRALLAGERGAEPVGSLEVVSLVQDPASQPRSLLDGLQAFYEAGCDLDWEAIFPGDGRRVPLPPPPWQRQRYWLLTPVTPGPHGRRHGDRRHPLMGTRISVAGRPGEEVWTSRVGARDPSYLVDHRVQGVPVFPASAYVEMFLQAAGELLGSPEVELTGLRFERAVTLPLDGHRELQLSWEPAPGEGILTVWTRSGEGTPGASPWTKVATGRVRVGATETVEEPPPRISIEALRARMTPAGANLYPTLARLGLEYGPRFRGVGELWRGEGEALGRLEPGPGIEDDRRHRLHPARLDAAFHVLFGTGAAAPGGLALPVGIRSLTVGGVPGPVRWVHARLMRDGGHVEGDIDLYDATGGLVARVRGLSLSAVEGRSREGFHRPVWREPEAALSPGGQRDLSLMGDPRLCRRMDAVLRGRGVPAERIRIGELPDENGEVIYFDAESTDEGGTGEAVAEAVAARTMEIVDLARRLAGSRGKTRAWLVTRGATARDPGEDVEPGGGAVWGIGASLALELPDHAWTMVDLPGEPAEADLALLCDLAHTGGRENRWRIRDGRAQVLRLEAGSAGEPLRMSRERTYLVTGGLGALGRRVVRWLVEAGAGTVLVVGRRGADAGAAAELETLGTRGAFIAVMAGDVADSERFLPALEVRLRGLPPLAGVFHAAGVLDDRSVLRLDPESVSKVMRPKVSGAWNLHRMTAEMDLDHFVMFSSIASVLGSPGQANYAAANGFLDALAAHRRARGLPGTSLQWGAWAEGMARAVTPRGAMRGIRPIDPDVGIDALARLLTSPRPQETFVMADWGVLRSALGRLPPLVEGLAPPEDPPEDGDGGRLIAILAGRPLPEVRPRLAAALRERVGASLGLPAADVALDLPLTDLGLDSLMTMEVQQWLEKELSLKIPAVKLLANPTLEELLDHLVTEITPGSVPEDPGEETLDLALQVHLADDIHAPRSPRAAAGAPRRVLLTGATGYLGAYVLAELLRQTDARIECLVRAADAREGLDRIRGNLRHYEIEVTGFDSRVRAVPGDLGDPGLGLAPEEHDRLAREIDAIHHVGAWVNFAYAYPVLAPVNVGGTEEILRLAARHRVKPVHFVSTLGMLLSTAYGSGRTIEEDDEDLSPEGLANGYEQTKWVADRVAALGRGREIPVNIYRVGLLTGHSGTGLYRKWDDFFPSWIKGCLQLGSIPILDTMAEMVPVDYVARLLVTLSCGSTGSGRTYHLRHPQPPTLDQFVETWERLGYPLRRLPFGAWKEELLATLARSRDNALYPHLYFVEMLDEKQSTFPRIGTANVRQAMTPAELACPPAPVLLERYLRYFRASGFLDPGPG